jgi:methyl-accepting chemotaxis protein
VRFRHRIWLLPIMTAVIVTAGILINSRIIARASDGLARVEQVQYPTVEIMRSLRSDFANVQETLQQAVAEGERSGIEGSEKHASAIRAHLDKLAALDGADRVLAHNLRERFEAYYSSAIRAVRILLTVEQGDSVAAISAMQGNDQQFTDLLNSSNEQAVAEFRSLLSDGARGVRRTLDVSMVTGAVILLGLGLGSWILIASVFRSLGGEPEAAVDIVRRIASGDFTTQVDVHSDDNTSLLHGSVTLRDKLGELIRDVHQCSSSIGSAAADTNLAVAKLSARTAQQASSLEETATSMEQMTVTVTENAQNARQASDLAIAARAQAEAGGQVVNRAVEAMSEINVSSKRIADIIGVIDEIAFQTNLLALNAAVEAARAGEQGRGFAVVAVEVRNLAQRSGTAAREIKSLIQDSVAKVADGTTLVDESGRHLRDIVLSVKKVADIIGAISVASQEQARGLEQVNVVITHLDQSTQENSTMVDQTSAVADAMTAQAKQLTDLVSIFRIARTEEPVPQPRMTKERSSPNTAMSAPPRSCGSVSDAEPPTRLNEPRFAQ